MRSTRPTLEERLDEIVRECVEEVVQNAKQIIEADAKARYLGYNARHRSHGMKIYLAARYSRHPEMRAYRDDLEDLGHTVTSRWINGHHQMAEATMFTAGAPEEVNRFALEDLEDLRAADLVINFTEVPRSGNNRGGRHVEFGMAHALGLGLIIVGHRENVFHYLPEVVFYPSWEEALKDLGAGDD